MTTGPPLIFIPVCPPTNYGGPMRYKRVMVAGECPIIATGTPPLAEREPRLKEAFRAEQRAIDDLKRTPP